MGWLVDSPVNGVYSVSALIAAQDVTLRLAAPDSKLVCQADSGPTGWNRLELGQIHLRAGLNLIELCDPRLKQDLEAQATASRSDTSWMRRARYGLQFHWTSQSQPRHGKQKCYADAVRAFDVRAFARMVGETGAGYVIMTTGHAEHYFPAPIAAIDAIMPGRTADRDLVSDLISANDSGRGLPTGSTTTDASTIR